MITLQLTNGNVLDAAADAILLTIDGKAKGMEGNIARAFAQRWPEIWNELEEDIHYPLPYGTVFDYEPEDPDCPFKLILVASLLPHRDVNTSAQKSFVRSSLHAALRSAMHDYRLASIATPILKCGWRLSSQEAFLAMLESLSDPEVQNLHGSVNVSIQESKEYAMLKSLANSLGFANDKK